MTATYEKIASTTVSTAQSTVDFTSIPATYTDLVLISNWKPTVSGNGFYFRVNGLTSGYSFTAMAGTGSSASSSRASSQTTGLMFDYFVGLPTTLTSMGIANFMNYSNTTTYKTVLSRGNNAGTSTEASVCLVQTTSAISSISLFMSAGNLDTGSTFTLYGISKEA